MICSNEFSSRWTGYPNAQKALEHAMSLAKGSGAQRIRAGARDRP